MRQRLRSNLTRVCSPSASRGRTAVLALIVAGALAAAGAPAQAAPFAYVTNLGSDNVSQFAVGSGGLLAPLVPPTVAAGDRPTGIAISPDAKSVYATAFGDGVSEYDVGAGGGLSPKNPPSVPAGNLPRDVVVSPDGKSVYVGNIGDELEDLSPSISQYDVGVGGKLSPKNPPSLDSCEAAAIAISPDGKNVYVACGEGLEIVQYAVGVDGTLSKKSFVEDDTSALDVVVSPDGKSVYAGFLGISQWDVGAGGELSPKNPPTVGDSRLGGDFAVSPDGRSLYASITFGNGFAGNQIDQYDIAADGTLTPKSPAAVGTGNFPRGLALTPDGRSLYAANFGSDEVSQYSVGSDGTLSPKSPSTGPAGQGPWGVAVTPAPQVPAEKHQCKKGGWRSFPAFRNQGQCMAFVNHAHKHK
jgi:DNA-binding beta-propeller fold protein YncE